MMSDTDTLSALQQQVREAFESTSPLAITGSGSKSFLGVPGKGTPLSTSDHCGVVSYEPEELVLTARAGTPLDELEMLLTEKRQMLAFEPPRFGRGATLGGTIACGLSGPRAPYCGTARDFVLGTRILNGRGEYLRFGGEVMKNVAGYDVSRLMTGAFGTLGVLMEISLKVLPVPECELTLILDASASEAIDRMNRWAGLPIPLSATCHTDEQLYLRLSGPEAAVAEARKRIGGDNMEEGKSDFWAALREHTPGFFNGPESLWRISLPSATPPLPLSGEWLTEWGGAQRWLRSDEDSSRICETIAKNGGHTLRFRAGAKAPEAGPPRLSGPLLALHRRLKQAFDPAGILNPGRLFPES